jgi:hypothetical protein
MIYLGNSKFRWPAMSRVLHAIEPVRESVGRIGLVGHGWTEMPAWAVEMQMEEAYYADLAYLERLGAEVCPAVPFEQVITWMSKAIFNPVLSRPTFSQLGFVTPRFFETPAASTIPVFGLDEAHVEEIYGPDAAEFTLGSDASDRILDLVERPQTYAPVVQRIREHLTQRHSHAARLQQLIEIVES